MLKINTKGPLLEIWNCSLFEAATRTINNGLEVLKLADGTPQPREPNGWKKKKSLLFPPSILTKDVCFYSLNFKTG
jgi:hypothetical protein